MVSNYSYVTLKMTSEEFKLFKSLAHRFYSLLLVTPSAYDEFLDGLKNLDIDVVSSLNVLRKLVDDNKSSDLKISNFLLELTDL